MTRSDGAQEPYDEIWDHMFREDSGDMKQRFTVIMILSRHTRGDEASQTTYPCVS